jgi:ABC-type lipoprotein release transport system permease subunit
MTNAKLSLRLAWRNIWRHRRRTLIVAAAIALGLALMMLYDGMVAGFNQAIYGNAIRVLGGNIQIRAAGYHDRAGGAELLPLADDAAVVEAARAQPQVLAASRRIYTSGMATNRAGAFGVSIIGVEPEQEQPVSLMAQHVVAGRWLNAADRDVVFIGKGLADAMGVAPGDRFTLAGRDTHDQMRRRTMTVAGIYDLGLADLEKRSIYVSLGEAQDLYGLSGQSTEVALVLQEIGQEPAVVGAVRPGLPGYTYDTWADSFPELESAVSTKSGIMNIFGVIIMVIAAIGILNMLLMAVYERTREIGVLGALGFKPRHITALFILEGALIGLVGVAFGVALGLLMNGILGRVGIDVSKFTSLTEYTALMSGQIYPTSGADNLLQRGLTVLIIAVLASYYPAREAARSEPAAALHHL